MTADRLANLGMTITDRLAGFGEFSRFCGQWAYWTVRKPAGYGRLHLLLPQLFIIGVRSIPVVMLVGAFVGAVIGLETYGQFEAIGQENKLGGVIALSVVKQIGPVLAAVMIAGRVGGAVSAEVGTCACAGSGNATSSATITSAAANIGMIERPLLIVLLLP